MHGREPFVDELRERRRRLRRESTAAERRLWSALRAGGSGAKFRRRHSLGEYIADFNCARAKLVVEVDGGSHYEPLGVLRDVVRTRWMVTRGLTVIRFTNVDVLTHLPEVVLAIERALLPSPQPSPRTAGRGGSCISAQPEFSAPAATDRND